MVKKGKYQFFIIQNKMLYDTGIFDFIYNLCTRLVIVKKFVTQLYAIN